jgi:hypothetical protein
LKTLGSVDGGRHVTLPEAQRKVWVYRLIGWGIVVLAGVVIAFVFLKHAYLNLPGGILFQKLGHTLRDAIDGVLATSPVLSFFWELTPTGDHQFIYFVLMSANRVIISFPLVGSSHDLAW